MSEISVMPLPRGSSWIARIAGEQFDHWGPLTGYASRDAYAGFLKEATEAQGLPRVLVAARGGTLLGSVNLLASEMTLRRELTPWMGQLFVMPEGRGAGIGESLCEAAAKDAASLGFSWLYLFTSGTLPAYYRVRGWSDVEEVDYLGKRRQVMRRPTR